MILNKVLNINTQTAPLICLSHVPCGICSYMFL